LTVREDEVKEIISNTAAKTWKEWNMLINSYKNTYWHNNSEEGEAIARRLINAGKVSQPRTEGKGTHNISTGHWAEIDANEQGE